MLTELMQSNPDLVFNNDGYENLSPEIVEANKDAIQRIEAILRSKIEGFVWFQNFKPRSDGSFDARYQVRYSPHFTGVAYTPLMELL
jgi:hypothetical protein